MISEDTDPEIVAKLILEKDEMRGKSEHLESEPKTRSKRCFQISRIQRSSRHHMVVNDPSLSVNLRSPMSGLGLFWRQIGFGCLDERIQGAGGLPPGVQGDVLCKVTDEDSMLSSFLVMRRGSRLIQQRNQKQSLLNS